MIWITLEQRWSVEWTAHEMHSNAHNSHELVIVQCVKWNCWYELQTIRNLGRCRHPALVHYDPPENQLHAVFAALRCTTRMPGKDAECAVNVVPQHHAHAQKDQMDVERNEQQINLLWNCICFAVPVAVLQPRFHVVPFAVSMCALNLHSILLLAIID